MSDQADIDPSLPLRLAKHEAFAKAWAEGKNFTEAARIAGYSGDYVRQTGAELATKPDIEARKTYLATKAAEGFVMDRQQWLESFRRLATKAEQAGDFAAAKGCLAEIGKACPGFYAPVETDGKLEITIIQAPVEV